MKRAALEVIEAAYQTEGSTHDWLRAIAKAMPSRGHSLGYLCTTYRIKPTGHIEFDDIAELGTPGALARVLRAASNVIPPMYVAATFATVTCTTALRAGPPEVRAITRVELPRTWGGFGIRDQLVVNGLDPTRRGVWIAGMFAREAELSRRDQATWSRVAAHIVASYRLRRAHAGEPDAVLTPEGKVEHAIDDARTMSARTSLRAAALAIDRARTRRSGLGESEAVATWHALVSGRWTLIDRVDRDGRRYFIARKNDPDVARHHELTRRESQVVSYAAFGHSNKLIAYELGISVSSVAVYLEAAMEKLGVASRADLIMAARAFGDDEAV